MNPAGQIRALEVEMDDPHFFRMYVVEPKEEGGAAFRDVTKDKTIGSLINKSMRGYIVPEFEDYLRAN
jgi:hypothetical protein